jgi:hypothetical protein
MFNAAGRRRRASRLDREYRQRQALPNLEGPDDAAEPPDEIPDADAERRLRIVRAAKHQAGRDLTDAELNELLQGLTFPLTRLKLMWTRPTSSQLCPDGRFQPGLTTQRNFNGE